ncbi:MULTISPECIES: integrase arm-type DNA-binding domain-containing protein [unclassified Bradyrhizobium]|uniref:tyrosine-type recombinase/integrase n=1 Tax=unclassified Bradyrhizobium TaxID=2631580 RepID=UPI001FF935A4|nr:MULTISPECIES: integrase arm-type DNA-binding domain-containing protein [unclassified Bradyrhizobium]MCK1611029.1 integrase arm-type DNA-binding domain-containing protein [Bradyrhizobium sp. 163]MCK1762783.1 integrase arm-type DNA-binding domain-containing protein [Bradyrhizobium sp. 136]
MGALHVLTALQVKNAGAGAKLSDGGGLRLDVDPRGGRSWVFRYKSPVTGKERYMGLGAAPNSSADAARKSLAEAREAAERARRLLRDGKDPIEHRNELRTAAKVEAAKAISFEDYADQYITMKEAGWKNPKHRQQWRNSLRAYAYPIIGAKAVSDIGNADVVKVLAPIWLTKRETAARVRGRIEQILDAATADEIRTGDNPARLKLIKHLLPEQKRKKFVQHHPALPYQQMPEFWKSLAADTSDAARMLRWIILTACRFNEAYALDAAAEVESDLWTIPQDRMKAERAHLVPLTSLALAQLPFRPVSDVTLSNCIKRHTNTRATTHGMRSTFRDWAGDETEAAWEVAEAAIAHATGDDSHAAYRRGTALAKRRKLMQAWAEFCMSASEGGEGVSDE